MKKKKRCGKCRVLKPVTTFPLCKAGKDGLYSYCRPCHAEYQKAKHPNRKEIDEKKARRIGLKKQGLKTCSSCKTVRFYDDFSRVSYIDRAWATSSPSCRVMVTDTWLSLQYACI